MQTSFYLLPLPMYWYNVQAFVSIWFMLGNTVSSLTGIRRFKNMNVQN